MFDKYREDPVNNPDTIQMDGTLNYFGDLGVNLEDTSLLVASEILQCPSLGNTTREGFIQAWSPINATSIPPQSSLVQRNTQRLSDPSERQQNGLYRRVYKHSFKLACPAGSKSVPLDVATEYWKNLFSPRGMHWKGQDGTDWFKLYIDFLGERWKKAVNKDLWDQTLLFALKTLEDGTLSWWSEESAWPGIIDDFVGYVKQSRPKGDAMDTS